MVESKMPTARRTVGYGEGKVLSICGWPEGNITLEARGKDSAGSWKTEERINLSQKAQEEIVDLIKNTTEINLHKFLSGDFS